MKRIFILFITIITLTACDQAAETPNASNTPVPPTATAEDLPTEALTSESTDVSEPTITQEEPTQDSLPLSFSKGTQNLGNTMSFGLAVADIDMDNDMDIFFANLNSGSKLWINNGNGNFAPSAQMFGPSNAEMHDVGIADLNGDSYPDIFLIGHNGTNRIFFNDGTGVFTESEQNLSKNANPQWLLLGDVDVDGDIDAIIMYSRSPNLLWLNDGTGFFTLSDTGYGGNSAIKMRMADFNADTFPDMVLINYNKPANILFNDGAGNFTDSGQSIGGEIGDDNIAIGDIDGDGDQDIITSSSISGYFKVWLNQDGSGLFEEAGTYSASGLVELFDADLDGDLDLITARFDNINSFWLNVGSGSFTSMGEIFENKRVLSIGVADFDADGDFDIVFGILAGSGGNRIFWNE